MGYLTVVVLNNDAMGEFCEDPSAFGEAILSGITRANRNHEEVSVPLGNYANYIHVHPSYHSTEQKVFVSNRGCVTELFAERLKNTKYYETMKSMLKEILKFLK